ncbi:hypothetical protein BGZ61DRAFT_454452 [Ilyonectria robusta]|uniref:uncharacterized protein n=1 Tax=Ilyonectria robusta TaxID=1079257 RepID=UPI001E8ECC2F|nr:uncharacterized protein BGZ61DRAFT_454452 [Ilyonectria robusta]KAH8686413.1 hypothetical protein BGZ61DRAFT_454452 [Ilyonectria robusta]
MENNVPDSPSASPSDSIGKASTSASQPRNRALAKASRRNHSKTRTGCYTCKRRKIKCDEQRPSCKNCVKHGVTCDFAQATQTTLRQNPSADSELNLLDLELLHNFTTLTYSTLTHDPAIQNLWKFGIIRLAVGCDYLMRSILAVSALHIAQHRPEQKDFYVSNAIIYHQIASRTAIRLMAEAKPENSECLWAFSISTIYFAMGSPRDNNTSLLIGESSFPDWLFLLDGVRHILNSLQTTSYTGVLSPMIADGAKRWIASHEPQHVKSNILDNLETQIRSNVTDPALMSIYGVAIDELRPQLSFAFSPECQNLDIMDAFVWQFAVVENFMPLLKVPTQEAVVIFAHHCLILNKLQSIWWLRGWDKFIMSRAWEILDQEHRLWIQWPIEEIGWVPP